MTAQIRVVVVDDDSAILRLTAVVLEDAGYLVRACSSPDEALRWLASEKIDLLLTDKNLAKSSGVELARAARELVPGLPVVLMTGAPDAKAVSEFKFEGYLAKPFRKNHAIVEAVASALEAHQALRQREAMSRQLQEVMAQLSPIRKNP